MKTIYRSRNATLENLPDHAVIIYHDDLFKAWVSGYIVVCLALLFAGYKASELLGYPVGSWSTTIKGYALNFCLVASLAGSYLFQKVFVKTHSMHKRGAMLYEDKTVGGEAFEGMKELFDAELKSFYGKNAPIVLATPYKDFKYSDLPRGLDKCVLLPDEVSRKHILIVGQTGSGKSNIIVPIVNQVKQMGGKLIITDTKSEYVPFFEADEAILIGAHLASQWQWDVSGDVVSAPDAINLMSIFVQVNDKDPHWGNSAITIGVAWLLHLMDTKAGVWDMKDFISVAGVPIEELRAIFKDKYPEAYNLIKDDTNGSASILSTLTTSLSNLKFIADEWDKRKYPMFSVREWLLDERTEKRALILLSGGDNAAMNQPLIRAMLTFAGRVMDGDSFENDTPENPRNLWVVCDEFQSFGKLEAFINPILERGRSRGIHAILGCQDISQLEILYGEHTVKFWLANFGMRILAGAGFGHTASTLSKDIGNKKFTKQHVSRTEQAGGVSTSKNEQDHPEEVITVDEIVSKTGFDKITQTGAAIYLIGTSKKVFIVRQHPKSFPKPGKRLLPAVWIEEANQKVKTARSASAIAKANPPATPAVAQSVHTAPAQAPISPGQVEAIPQRLVDEELPDYLDDVPDDYEDDGEDNEEELEYYSTHKRVSTELTYADIPTPQDNVSILELISKNKSQNVVADNLTNARKSLISIVNKP